MAVESFAIFFQGINFGSVLGNEVFDLALLSSFWEEVHLRWFGLKLFIFNFKFFSFFDKLVASILQLFFQFQSLLLGDFFWAVEKTINEVEGEKDQSKCTIDCQKNPANECLCQVHVKREWNSLSIAKAVIVSGEPDVTDEGDCAPNASDNECLNESTKELLAFGVILIGFIHTWKERECEDSEDKDCNKDDLVNEFDGRSIINREIEDDKEELGPGKELRSDDNDFGPDRFSEPRVLCLIRGIGTMAEDGVEVEADSDEDEW